MPYKKLKLPKTLILKSLLIMEIGEFMEDINTIHIFQAADQVTLAQINGHIQAQLPDKETGVLLMILPPKLIFSTLDLPLFLMILEMMPSSSFPQMPMPIIKPEDYQPKQEMLKCYKIHYALPHISDTHQEDVEAHQSIHNLM